MEIGEEELPGAHQPILRLDGLLHLDDHVGPAPDALGVRHQTGSGGGVVLVGDATPHPRALLHHHLMPRLDQRVDAGRDHPDPVLVILDFLRDSDPHVTYFPDSAAAFWGAPRVTTLAARLRWLVLFLLRPLRSHFDAPLEEGPFSDDHPRRGDVSLQTSREGATSTRSVAWTLPTTRPPTRTTWAEIGPCTTPSLPTMTADSTSISPCTSPRSAARGRAGEPPLHPRAGGDVGHAAPLGRRGRGRKRGGGGEGRSEEAPEPEDGLSRRNSAIRPFEMSFRAFRDRLPELFPSPTGSPDRLP